MRLKEEKIDKIFSSDLARTVDTTAGILKSLSDTPVEYVEEIRERYLGKLEGMRADLVDWEVEGDAIEFYEGESIDQFCSRLFVFLESVLKEHLDDTVLFVCHGGVIRGLRSLITKQSYTELRESLGSAHNGSISIFELDANMGYEMVVYDDTSHLD